MSFFKSDTVHSIFLTISICIFLIGRQRRGQRGWATAHQVLDRIKVYI
jgi:hypothetical protein